MRGELAGRLPFNISPHFCAERMSSMIMKKIYTFATALFFVADYHHIFHIISHIYHAMFSPCGSANYKLLSSVSSSSICSGNS